MKINFLFIFLKCVEERFLLQPMEPSIRQDIQDTILPIVIVSGRCPHH